MRAALVTLALVTVLFCLTLGTSAAFANPGADNVSSAIATTAPLFVTGSLDSTTTDIRDVYAIPLVEGWTYEASMTVSNPTTGTNFDIFLYRKTAALTSINETTTRPAMWGNGPLHERFTFMAAEGGTYLLDVSAWKGSGNYTLSFRRIPKLNFGIGYLSVPKTAKRYARVNVSARVTPAYNGEYSPVWFWFYRYENGKYRRKAIVPGGGIRNPGDSYSKLTASYKFPKRGKWRVKAEFWDEAHASKFTSPKYITIK